MSSVPLHDFITQETCSCGKHYAEMVKPACRDLIPFKCEGISWRRWRWVARPGLWSVFRLSHRFLMAMCSSDFLNGEGRLFMGLRFVCWAVLCWNSKQTLPNIAKKLAAHKGLIGTKDLRWTMKCSPSKQKYKISSYWGVHIVSFGVRGLLPLLIYVCLLNTDKNLFVLKYFFLKPISCFDEPKPTKKENIYLKKVARSCS